MSDRDLIIAAARLARRAPDDWKKFLDSLTDYTETKVVECVSAQIDMLPVAQGRAQSLLKLRQLLEDCSEQAEAITNKAPPKPVRP